MIQSSYMFKLNKLFKNQFKLFHILHQCQSEQFQILDELHLKNTQYFVKLLGLSIKQIKNIFPLSVHGYRWVSHFHSTLFMNNAWWSTSHMCCRFVCCSLNCIYVQPNTRSIYTRNTLVNAITVLYFQLTTKR